MKPNRVFFWKLRDDGVQIELLNTFALILSTSLLALSIYSAKRKKGNLFLLASWFFHTNRYKRIVIRLNEYGWHMPWIRETV